jgi:two-component system, NarL family, invasion response regulator UvrY
MIQTLIIDDHPVVRHGLHDLLARAMGPLQTAHARDGAEALELLRRQAWDLVLLDINLPGRSGLEVLEDIRRLWPRTPVLVVSMYPEEEFALRAFKLGAAGYLNKQGAYDELVTAVKKILGGGRYITVALAEKPADQLGARDLSAPHEALSSRELQVLQRVAMGRTIKEIAAELALSEKTIGTYRLRLAEKLGLSGDVELARYALEHHLVEWGACRVNT